MNDTETTSREKADNEDNSFMSFALAVETTEYTDEPVIFYEAWYHSDREERELLRASIRKEFNNMIKRGAWRRMKKNEVLHDRQTIGSRKVFKRKQDS